MTIHDAAHARANSLDVTATVGGIVLVGKISAWDAKADFGLPGGSVLIAEDNGFAQWAPLADAELA